MNKCARCGCVVNLASDCHLTGYCAGAGGGCGCHLYVSPADPKAKDYRIDFLEKNIARYTKRYVDEVLKRRKAEEAIRLIQDACKAIAEAARCTEGEG